MFEPKKNLSIRQQALNILSIQAETAGVISIPEGARTQALKDLEAAELLLHDARLKFVLTDKSRYFRLAMFGSARLGPETPEYQNMYETGSRIVLAMDAALVTGGGPGLMEAANRGARDAIKEALEQGNRIVTASSHGVLLSTLPAQEHPNSHLDLTSTHPEFGSRLQRFFDTTDGVYVGVGGYGSALELLYAMQLRQVGHLEPDFPLVAHPFWERTLRTMGEDMYTLREEADLQPVISEKDLNLVQFSDDPKKITSIFLDRYDKWNEELGKRVRIIPASA